MNRAMDLTKTAGTSPPRTIEMLRLLQRQGYQSVRIGALTRTNIPEEIILSAAARLGLTVQTIAGSLWIRL